MEFLLLIFIVQGVIFGFFCGYIAEEKGRSYSNWFALGFCFSILAVFALIAVPKVESTARNIREGGDLRPVSGQTDPMSIPQHLFDGPRDITLPAYQLFLIKRFGVEKNNTLDKFAIGNDVFDDLQTALANVDVRYAQLVAELERDRADAEQRKEQEELRRIESAALAQKQKEALQQTFRKAMPWAIGAALVICVVGGLLLVGEAETRLARRAADGTIESKTASQPGYAADVPDRCKGSTELEKCIQFERRLANETEEQKNKRRNVLEAER